MRRYEYAGTIISHLVITTHTTEREFCAEGNFSMSSLYKNYLPCN